MTSADGTRDSIVTGSGMGGFSWAAEVKPGIFRRVR